MKFDSSFWVTLELKRPQGSPFKIFNRYAFLLKNYCCIQLHVLKRKTGETIFTVFRGLPSRDRSHGEGCSGETYSEEIGFRMILPNFLMPVSAGGE